MYGIRFSMLVSTISMPLLLFLLVGCGAFVPTPQPTPTLAPEEQDQSWLTDQPCKVPCWYGLEPGVSTLDEVLATVEELPFIDPESKRERDSQTFSYRLKDRVKATIVAYDCQANTDVVCAGFDFVDDTLFSIDISSNLPMTIAEIIAQIGAPDLLSYSKVHPEGDSCGVNLVWMDRQVILYSNVVVNKYWFIKRGLCRIIYDSGNRIPSDLVIYGGSIIPADEVQALATDEENNYIPWVGLIDE